MHRSDKCDEEANYWVLDDFAIDRLRAGLRIMEGTTKAYYDSKRGSADTYKLLAEAIFEKTGVSVPKERLRQFARGVTDNSRPGSKIWPGLKNERLVAVAEFVTDEDDPASPWKRSDLQRSHDYPRAALALHDFLSRFGSELALLTPEQIQGSFRAIKREGAHTTLSTLTFEPADQVMKATLEQLYFEEPRLEDRSSKLHDLPPENSEVYRGWAIIEPSDKLVVFLRKNDAETDYENVVGFTILLGAQIYADEPVNDFHMVEGRGQPWADYRDAPKQIDQLAQDIIDKAMYRFSRV